MLIAILVIINLANYHIANFCTVFEIWNSIKVRGPHFDIEVEIYQIEMNEKLMFHAHITFPSSSVIYGFRVYL